MHVDFFQIIHLADNKWESIFIIFNHETISNIRIKAF